MNLARNVVTTLSARIVGLGISLVSAVVLARSLGPEGRGLFALALLLPELIKAFGLLGIEQANAVYAGLEPNKRRALSWHSVFVAFGVGGALALAGMAYVSLGAPGLHNTLRGPTWFYMLPLVMLPGRILVEYWLAILRGMNRIVVVNCVEVAIKLVSLVLVCICVVGLKSGVPGAIWIDSVVVVASVVALAVLLASAGAIGRPQVDRALWTRTTRFARPSYFAGVMTYMNYRVDQFIIAILLPPQQLALYVIAVEIAERIWIVPGSIGSVLLPHLTNAPHGGKTDTALMARHAVLWTGAACGLVFMIAPVAVDVLFSPAFAEAALPLRWLLPGIFTLAVGKVLIAELQCREKIAFTVWLSLAAAVLNGCCNFWLIPRMGIAGAALASSISYILVGVVVMECYVRETGVLRAKLLPRTADILVYVVLVRSMGSRIAARFALLG